MMKKNETSAEDKVHTLLMQPQNKTVGQYFTSYVLNAPTLLTIFGRVALTAATAWANSNQEPFVFSGMLTFQIFNTVTSAICVSLLWNIEFKITAWLVAAFAVVALIPIFIFMLKRHMTFQDIQNAKVNYRPVAYSSRDLDDEYNTMIERVMQH